MLLPALCSITRQWFGRAVGLAWVAQFLVLTTHTETSASALPQSSPRTVIAKSAPASFPAADENRPDDVHPGVSSGESLITKTAFTNTTSSQAGTFSVPSTEGPAGEPPSLTAIEENHAPDWNGVWRDTGILLGSQVAVTGILYLLPENVSGWSEEQKENCFKNYSKNFGHPAWDSDDFYMNYILHPYWGATYYIRARERGLDKVPSFLYSALMSAMFEFGFECFFEKPSIQDLIVTPVGGSLLGAYLFEPLRESIKRKQELRWYDSALLVITDPIGVLSAAFEKLFGIKSSVRINYSGSPLQRLSDRSTIQSKSNRTAGVFLQFPFD
ncbi:DUF3943 domain-containing protein [Geobacter sp. SVR]|uniref:DUF3943 domain-containing protein n=1 Tax=Geobacter sp. SVR TaxID=2495594 RepID=UPI00143EF525|nr:DUF3943 domain-containing protein [Geobacter sp. SVR]BCS53346.1 hypothetical protein GSVR_16540 [Geobacter sp. SVR]GCF85528.1 hypothetical protein GSbR_21280 [Geobacter sp. SVR]